MRCSAFLRKALPFAMLLLVNTLHAENEQDVINMLPESSRASTAEVARLLRVPVRFIDPPADLMEDLRWRTPSPARVACEESSARIIDELRAEDLLDSVSPDGTAVYLGLLERASNQLQFMDLEAVLNTLSEARKRLPCVDSILGVQELRPLYLYEAVSHFYLRDGQDRIAFRNLLAVDNRSFLEPEYPPSIKEAFTSVFHELLNVPLVSLDASGLKGEVYIDGVAVSEEHPLHPGLHVVQVRGPGGSIRTVQVALESEQAQETPLWLADLVDFGLPTAVEVRENLSTALEKGSLTLPQAEAMERYVKSHRLSGLIFAVEVDGALSLRGFLSNKGLCDAKEVVKASRGGHLPSPRVETEGREPKNPIGIQVALGFGGRMLLGPEGAFELTGAGAGYVLRVEYPLAGWMIGGRIEWTRHFFRPISEDDGCGGYDGEGTPSEAQAQAAVACLPNRAAYAFALSLGRAFSLTETLRVVPALGLEALRLPNTLINAEDPASIRIADMWYSGLMARPRLEWVFSESAPEMAAEVELDVGGFAGRVDDSWMWTLPVGATVGVRAEF